MKLSSTQILLLKLGAAKGQYPAAWRLIDIAMPEPPAIHFSFQLNRQKLRAVRRREGRYLLRSNLCGKEPAELWQFYIQLVEIEAVFKNLKDDLQTASDLSSTSKSHRSAHLCCLYRLLPACHAAGAA